jgi:hypothetical protein
MIFLARGDVRLAIGVYSLTVLHDERLAATRWIDTA